MFFSFIKRILGSRFLGVDPPTLLSKVLKLRFEVLLCWESLLFGEASSNSVPKLVGFSGFLLFSFLFYVIGLKISLCLLISEDPFFPKAFLLSTRSSKLISLIVFNLPYLSFVPVLSSQLMISVLFSSLNMDLLMINDALNENFFFVFSCLARRSLLY